MQRRIFRYLCLFAVSAIAVMCVLFAFISNRFGSGFVSTLPYLIPAITVLLVLVFIGAQLLSKKLVRLRLDGRSPDAELNPLREQIKDQGAQLRKSEARLEEREGGLRMIMENMSEGIVFLRSDGIILSMNRSAEAMFGVDNGSNYEGKHAFAVCSNPYFQAAVYDAMGGRSSQEILYLSGTSVELLANPVRVDSMVSAVILLLFDVTEKLAADQMRREFSANVSHELKTPLTSISGYAELLTNGLVQPQDVSRFSEKIYHEAQRLIDLINDIIKLSRLDENEPDIPTSDVDLQVIALSVASRLAAAAERYQVSVSVTGEPCVINGSEPLLEEMIFNLSENAIKYNRPGGTVEIHTSVSEKDILLSVIDTGIGIPREHQSRVFERFYRVDKSHSKETGGTGLGLSIVKHGAHFHKATIDLDSIPDRGTTIRLRFPRSAVK